jgi:phosphatidylethanolamine/phosphatidyl-N-methylethanolamine N-methyltransferase
MIAGETTTFFASWLRNPLGIAAVLPSGPAVADACAAQLDLARDGAVLELGAGTGSLTRGLLRRGCPPERVIALERERELLRVLRASVPGIRAVAADATQLGAVLDRMGERSIAAVLSSLPIKWFPLETQRTIVEQCFDRLGPGGRIVQITNAFASPLPCAPLGIEGREVSRVWRNAVPVQIWSYASKR